MARRPGNHREGVTGRAGQGGDGIYAMAVIAPGHGGLDGDGVNMCLNRMARPAADGIGCSVVIGMIEGQGLGTIGRPNLVEIGVTLGASDERTVANHCGGRGRYLVGRRAPAEAAAGSEDRDEHHTARTPGTPDHPRPPHASAPAPGIALMSRPLVVATQCGRTMPSRPATATRTRVATF